MNDYDFSTLNDKEFENLVIDLVSRDKNKKFERFKAGRDGGIDGRYYGDDGKQEIIQCKHYLKTGYSGLISSLKKNYNGKSEIDKVRLLNPEKYIFVTSLPLSASNKTEIKELFEPYIKRDSDIYGQEDLNNLLKENRDIEENHYKLWISSTTVLQRIFNNAIKGRSEFILEEIQDKIKYYVMTRNHNKAIEKLESSHTIIIAGEPGIGKTTLAEQIALNYIEKGFEFCVINKDISEAESIFEKDKKQIFYFDDFLGANYLNVLEAHTDSQIMQFIARVKKDDTKRFILTSRTNILNQGILHSDRFKTKKLDSDEFILKVDDLSEIDKAKILYNHIWHSNLNEEYINELYKEKRYKQIIKHRNFNPRLIEFITDIDRINSQSVNDYWEDIQSNLENPSEIWSQTFDRQSDEYIRNIVALVVFNGNRIEDNELKNAYYRLNSLMKLQNPSHISKNFDSVIEETVKYFLKRSILYDGKIEYTLFNPSIADFIINRYKNNNNLIYIINSLKTIKSLNVIKSISNKIDSKLYQKILLSIQYSKDINYLIRLAYLYYEICEVYSNNIFIKKLEEIINIILKSKEKIILEDIVILLSPISYLIYENKLKINIKVVKLLIKSLNSDTSYSNFESNIRELIGFLESNKLLNNNIINILNNKIRDYFENSIYNDFPNFIQNKTLKKIEELIYNDIKEQTKLYINDFLYRTNLNKYNIYDKVNNKIIEEKIKYEIIESCKDRIHIEIFGYDEYKTDNISTSKINKLDNEIEDLFERNKI